MLIKQQLQQIKFSELRFLRSVAGYRRIDNKRNTDIRQEIFNLGAKMRVPTELLGTYFKNANLLKSSEDV
jgi:hypothetical protein